MKIKLIMSKIWIIMIFNKNYIKITKYIFVKITLIIYVYTDNIIKVLLLPKKSQKTMTIIILL